MRRLWLAAALLLSGCASAPKAGPDLDRYLDEFEAVRGQAERLYLQAGAVADERAQAAVAASTQAAAVPVSAAPGPSPARAALEARLDALRLVARYNRLLTALARGEDPKALKSEMKAIGGKLADYKPSAQAQQYALASAIPYLGALVQGAAIVQEALAKRKFMQAVHAAQKPIASILDVLIADSKPLEELLVEQLQRERDPYRARVDALGGRAYRQLAALRPDPPLTRSLERLNALRAASGRPPVPHEPAASAAAPTTTDEELLAALVDEAEGASQEERRLDAAVAAERAVFARYRETLAAAKGALAALDSGTDAERGRATDRFSAEALDLRRETTRLKEAQ